MKPTGATKEWCITCRVYHVPHCPAGKPDERERLREVLTQIAAFNDTGANEVLQRTGSYSGFDEPGAVQIARAALNKVGGGVRDGAKE